MLLLDKKNNLVTTCGLVRWSFMHSLFEWSLFHNFFALLLEFYHIFVFNNCVDNKILFIVSGFTLLQFMQLWNWNRFFFAIINIGLGHCTRMMMISKSNGVYNYSSIVLLKIRVVVLNAVLEKRFNSLIKLDILCGEVNLDLKSQ